MEEGIKRAYRGRAQRRGVCSESGLVQRRREWEHPRPLRSRPRLRWRDQPRSVKGKAGKGPTLCDLRLESHGLESRCERYVSSARVDGRRWEVARTVCSGGLGCDTFYGDKDFSLARMETRRGKDTHAHYTSASPHTRTSRA
jgi:hypothetical protein